MQELGFVSTLRAPRLCWAVASIHGDVDRLRDLHDELRGRIVPGDYLVYLGNYLGHGYGVREVVDELLLFRRFFLAQSGVQPEDIIFLRGGQEEMWHKLLQIQFAPKPRGVLEWMMRHGLDATLRAYYSSEDDAYVAADKGNVALAQWTGRLRDTMRAADGHNALMSSLRHAATTEHGTMLLVHTGIDPHRKLQDQGDLFWWGWREFERLTDFYRGGTRVIRGFDPFQRGVVAEEAYVTIDGGCGYGGTLVAACFDASGEIVDMIEV